MKQLLFFLVSLCTTQESCDDEDKRIECEGLRLYETILLLYTIPNQFYGP